MAPKSRALFIDLLKGLALVVMIEVHVFNSLLLPALKQSWWWPSLNFINGLVAPSFTFTSGLVFVLSLQKGMDEVRKFGKPFWKKISRIGLILLAGYTLHVPYYSFRKILANQNFETLSQLFIVDVLQIIATGLLILLFARMIIKNEKHFYNFTGLATILVIVAGPLAWSIDFSNFLPLFISQYFNKMHGSLFPVFPWWSFIFAGAYVSKFYIEARAKNNEKEFAKKLILLGGGFYLTSVLFLYLLFPNSLDNIKPHPFFFLERFGVILFILGIGWFYINRKENYNSILLDVSRESLLVYWLHLQFIYRKVFSENSITDFYGDKLGLIESSGITIALIIIMMIIAKYWGKLKMKKPIYATIITSIVLIVGLIAFLIRPH